MKKIFHTSYFFLLTSSFVASGGVCNCAVCPLNQNALVWENDKFGAYAYGPGNYHVWSGIDIFNKKIPGSAAVAWSQDPALNNFSRHPNIHDNRGEGMDNYTMGASRGVGGVAMFGDGEWKTYPGWESSRIIHTGDDYVEFELVYPAFSAAGKMTYHITQRRGERFFRNDVSFERMPKDFLVGPALDLEPKRDHKGNLHEERGMVSLFEDPKGKDGSMMEAVFVANPSLVTNVTDHLNCRVLAFRGQKNFTYWAGASWSLAGEITTPAAWHGAVRNFLDRTIPDRPVLPTCLCAPAPRPRLFVGEGGFAALRKKLEATELGRLCKDRLVYEADAMLKMPLLERKMDGRRLLHVSRSAIDRIGKLAMAYQLTGNVAYARRAADEAANVSRFSDWNPSHFLDTAEMTLAVALARDWLDDVLTPDEKRLLTDAIVKKGLTQDERHLQCGWWARAGHNWNQVCNGGLAAGAWAVYEDCPRTAEAVILRTARCLPFALKAYAGGNFPEGPAAYWEYATDYTAVALDTLQRAMSDVSGLLAADGLAEQGTYINMMTGPTGSFFNYSDSGATSESKRHAMAAPWFLARQFGRMGEVAECEIANLRKSVGERERVETTYRSFSRFFPLVLLWMPDSLDGLAPAATPLCRAFGGSNPVAVLRNGRGREDWYVGIKAGTPGANHGHMDVGSFVLDAGGVRWAADLGCEPYGRVEQMGKVNLWDMQQDSSRWSLFRLGVEGHGTLVIDGARQRLQGTATVAVEGARATVNLSPVYPGAKSVVRTFSLSQDALAVDDILTGLREGAAVTWNMITAAKAVADGGVLRLAAAGADGKERILRMEADGGLAWEVEPLDKPRMPADSPNPGMTRVRLAGRAAQDGRLAMRVTFRLVAEKDI